MRTTTGPPRITALEIAPGRAVTVFRIVRSDSTEDPVLLNSFRSNYELGGEPRKPVKLRDAVVDIQSV